MAFDAFLGTWSMHRKVLDYRTGSVFNFSGTAVITPASFNERGQVAVGGNTFSAERAYAIEAGQNSVSVLFPNGSKFIELDLTGMQAVYHLCGRDTYLGRFFFRGQEAWAERWRVSGPNKDYASLARYHRPRAD